MNFQEKYDQIINSIEEMLRSGCTPREIINKLPSRSNFSKGPLGDAFYFITGIPLRDYILQRQMIHLLQYRFETQCTLEKLVETFDFSDVATFSKRCKKHFGISPSEISSDWLKKQAPLTLQTLLKTEDTLMNTPLNLQASATSYFGVSEEQFDLIENFIELRSVYGFSEDEAEFAYKVSSDHNVPLEDAFEFVDELKLSYGNIHLAKKAKDFPFKMLTYLYFHFHLSVSEAKEDIWNFGLHGFNKLTDPLRQALEVYYSNANSWLGYDVVNCQTLADLLNRNGLDISDLDDIISYASSPDISSVTNVIQNYDKYISEDMSADLADFTVPDHDLADAYDETLFC